MCGNAHGGLVQFEQQTVISEGVGRFTSEKHRKGKSVCGGGRYECDGNSKREGHGVDVHRMTSTS